MKKQLLLVALFSAGIVGNASARLSMKDISDKIMFYKEKFQKNFVCQASKKQPTAYKYAVKILPKLATKGAIGSNGIHIQDFSNMLVSKIFSLPFGGGSALKGLVESELGIEADDVADVVTMIIEDELEEKLGIHSVDGNLNAETAGIFISNLLDPKSCPVG